MAGVLSGDHLHHGINDVHEFSYDKLEEPDYSSSNWYFIRKMIEECSPSRKDGIDAKKETYFRKSYCTFLQDLGMRLKVPQVTIATAIIFCHRFFLRQSHAKNDRRTIATVCMFLAGKVEETPRPLKDVILVSYEIIHKKDPAAIQRIKQKEVYEQQKELILLAERVVLATLGFDLNVNHPYKPLVEAIKKFKVAQNALAQVAWNFVNDGLRTSLCLQFKPHHIAAGAIFLAAKFLKVKLPSDGEKFWWQEFDVTPRQLEEVSNQMLELYEQNRVAPPSNGSEVDGSMSGARNHRAQGKATGVVEDSQTTPTTSANHPETSSHVALREDATNKYGMQTTQGALFSQAEQSYSIPDNQGGSQKGTRGPNLDHWSTGQRLGSSGNDMGPLVEGQGRECMTESNFRMERPMEETERKDASERVERKDEHADYRASNGNQETGGGGGGGAEGKRGYSTDVIRKIDRDKVKAALEKRRKSRVDVNDLNPATTRKTDMLDDDDLIEMELENGVELAAEAEKTKQERRQVWLKSSYRVEQEVHKEHEDDFCDGDSKRSSMMVDYRSQTRKRSRSLDSEDLDGNDYSTEASVIEEGELPGLPVQGVHSPKAGLGRSPLPPRVHRKKSPHDSREPRGKSDAEIRKHCGQNSVGYRHQESHKEHVEKGRHEYREEHKRQR